LILFKINEKAALAISAMAAFLLLLCLYIQSNGMLEGGQDSYNHFLISKYAFKYPNLLLDQWGKPVYTILAHPFCAFGLQAAVLFNILCLTFAAFLVGLTVLKLELKYAWLACWICVFCPISLGNAIATLTEPLNMLMLSAAFYMWVTDKKITATLLFSFLPWIRTEGFVIIVPFLVYLIVSKQLKYIPWLIAGTLIFNILGWYQTGKPFWFITENPYFKVETEADRFAPEPGSFLFYIRDNKNIFGNLTLIFSALGAAYFTFKYFFKKLIIKQAAFIFWVIAGVFVAYYFAHSFIIWRGMLGTHGMTRVMMVIVPCIAFFAVYFFNVLFKMLGSKYNILKPVLLLLFAFITTYQSYRVKGYPTQFYNFNKTSVKQITHVKNLDLAYQYLEKNYLTGYVIYHQLPIFDVRYGRDPFAKPLSPDWKTAYIWSIDLDANWAPKNSIIIWDRFHAQREGNMPFEKISTAKDYKLLTLFTENDSAASDNDIYIFQKIN